LEREVAVIESDWAALGWAIGSTRVLLDRRAAPLTSLDKVPDMLQKHVEYGRNGYGLWWQITAGPLYAIVFFVRNRHGMERIGCSLGILASIIAGIYWLMERRRLNVPWYDSIYDDPVACARFYKSELGRIRFRYGIVISTLICTFVGQSLSYEATSDASYICAICGLILLAFLPVMLQVHRNNLRRIEEIDALLAEREHGAEL
jgi:hypothetical protein